MFVVTKKTYNKVVEELINTKKALEECNIRLGAAETTITQLRMEVADLGIENSKLKMANVRAAKTSSSNKSSSTAGKLTSKKTTKVTK